jgi:hypothetical protein
MIGLRRAFLVAGLVLLLTALRPSATRAAEADFAVQNGWFFSQAGGGAGHGYAVTDDGGVAFWRDFQRLGGTRTLGYPASWRFVGADGFIYQATQAALLQWRPDEERAVLANSFDTLSEAQRDEWLRTARAIPPPVGDDGSRGDAARSAAIRLAWLEDEGIRAYYFANPNPSAFAEWPRQRAIELYGLPTSRPQRLGPFVVQRFQRVALQHWVEDVPGMPPVGSVVRVLGGDLLKEAGLLPGHALQPAAAESARARFDPELLARLSLLAELPPTQPLHGLAMQAPISFVWAPLDPEVGGLFSARRRWVAINVRWYRADPKAVAAVLAHELSHLRDLVERKPLWTQAGCLETEQDAFRTQATVWELFYGSRGKRGPESEIERQQNYILSSLRNEPDAFAQRVSQIYQHECGQLRP